MSTLTMELRAADVDARTIDGIVAPYDAVSYLVPNPGGERIMRGAFAKSIRQRSARVPLFRHHDHSRAVGLSSAWDDGSSGLAASFAVRSGTVGDEILEEARDGYLSGLSVGFKELIGSRGKDGVHEVREAQLVEVSLTAVPAYAEATVTAVRSASVEDIRAMFGPAPVVNLSPLPPLWR